MSRKFFTNRQLWRKTSTSPAAKKDYQRQKTLFENHEDSYPENCGGTSTPTTVSSCSCSDDEYEKITLQPQLSFSPSELLTSTNTKQQQLLQQPSQQQQPELQSNNLRIQTDSLKEEIPSALSSASSKSNKSNKTRRLSFSRIAHVILIPTLQEISEKIPSSDLYWNQEDYFRFKQDALFELQSFWKLYGGQQQQQQQSLYRQTPPPIQQLSKLLYQPANTILNQSSYSESSNIDEDEDDGIPEGKINPEELLSLHPSMKASFLKHVDTLNRIRGTPSPCSPHNFLSSPLLIDSMTDDLCLNSPPLENSLFPSISDDADDDFSSSQKAIDLNNC